MPFRNHACIVQFYTLSERIQLEITKEVLCSGSGCSLFARYFNIYKLVSHCNVD